MDPNEILTAVGNSPFTRIALIITGLIIIQIIIRRFIGQLITKIVERHTYESLHEARQREATLTTIFRTASAVVLWVIGIVLILQQLEVNITALLTGAGLIGIVVGFGAQSTIKDFLSGLFVIVENQYKVGDTITINNDYSGVVELVTIRLTRLRDLDGSLHFIPNGQISTVSNHTFEYSNVLLEINVSYDTDIAKVETIINEEGQVMAAEKKFKESIIEPIQFLHVESFGESAVNIQALGRVAPGLQWDIASEFRKRLKRAFTRHHIEIPFPQRVIHQAKRS